MRVGIVSYPALWQRKGGLQIQIEKTFDALGQLGVDSKVLNLVEDKMGSFDIIHAFSGAHGMHTVIQEAKRQGAKVVLSPVLQPETNLSRFYRDRILDNLVSRLSSNRIKTSYIQIKTALMLADRVLALSSKEFAVIEKGYQIPRERIAIIPNGVDDTFFENATCKLSKTLDMPGGYVLVSASISEYKNQLAVIQATERPVVLVGEVTSPEYLQKCLQVGGSRVRYVGVFEHADPLLKSLYSNAAVNVLVSRGEAGPLCVIESLASKVPAVVTARNGLMLQAKPPMLQYVGSQDKAALKKAIELGALASPLHRSACQEMVKSLQWNTVAKKIMPVYQTLLR